MAEDIQSQEPNQSTPEPSITENVQTLSSSTPNTQAVEVPGGTMTTDSSKTMRNMMIAAFLTGLVIIVFLLYARFTGNNLTKESTVTPTQEVVSETVAPTDGAAADEEAIEGIEIQEPDFTEIEKDVNQL